jgi:hypothetical protein
MAAQIGWSMTIIERNDMLHLAQQEDLVWKFKTLGQVEIIDAGAFDAASMLAGSSMAFCLLRWMTYSMAVSRRALKELMHWSWLPMRYWGWRKCFALECRLFNFRECFVAGGSTVTG